MGEGARQAAAERHEQRRAHPFIADIGDDNANAAPLGKGKNVIPVTGHFARRMEARGQLPTFGLRHFLGQEIALKTPRNRHIVEHLLAFESFAFFDATLAQFQVIGDLHLQQRGRERFGEIILRAQGQAGLHALGALPGRQHENDDAAQILIYLELFENILAGHVRQMDLQEHQFWLFGFGNFQSVLAGFGHQGAITLGLQATRQRGAPKWTIINN